MDFITDYFGNEIRVGDLVIFAKANHTSLTIGEVIKLGSKGTSVDVKVVFAGSEGYSRAAVRMIGDEMKVMLKKTVTENNTRSEKIDNEYKCYWDEYETDYVYCIKWEGKLPEQPQYRYIKSIPR